MDTLRIDVEQRTWVPTLLKVPFPDGVIDELRNKYGKYRTRHEDSFIEKVERRERFENEVQEKMALRVLSPKARWAQAEKLKRERERREKIERGEALPEGELDEGLLERIGGLMKRNREAVERVRGLEQERRRLEYWSRGEGRGEEEGLSEGYQQQQQQPPPPPQVTESQPEQRLET